MSGKQILIITDDKPKFSAEALKLSVGSFLITGAESLLYIGLSRFSSVVLDCKSIAPSLKKVSLGIRDNAPSEALWQLLGAENGPKVYLLVSKKQAPSREMIDLGIEYALLSELKGLAEEAADINKSPLGGQEAETDFSLMLTADDVRAMHQRGVRYLPPNARLTMWASEVAESLQMGFAPSEPLKTIYRLRVNTKAELKASSNKIFALSSKYPEMLFLTPLPLIPAFNEMFPSLRGKVVSPTIHWAKQGAFTGEVSALMLAEQGCCGAIIPDEAPYKEPKALAELVKQASENFLVLFYTFSLATSELCGIIATDKALNKILVKLYKNASGAPLPLEGAVMADDGLIGACDL